MRDKKETASQQNVLESSQLSSLSLHYIEKKDTTAKQLSTRLNCAENSHGLIRMYVKKACPFSVQQCIYL